MFAVFFAIEPADRPGPSRAAWNEFLQRANGQPPRRGEAQHPSESGWLLNLPADTPLLGRLVQTAEDGRVAYRVLYFDQPPNEFQAFAP